MNIAAKSIIARVASFFVIAALSQSAAPASVIYDKTCPEGAEVSLPVSKWSDQVPKPRGVVLMVHGITQNAASLGPLCTTLAGDGFLVYGIDLRGHGWWHFDNSRKTKGYYCNYKQSVKDVDQVLPLLKDEYPDLPIFMVGESAGAAVVLRAAAAAPHMVHGLVLVATGSKSARVKTSWLVGDLAKNFYRPNHQIDVTRYQRKYGTDDLAALEVSLKDPRQRPTMSLRELFGADLFVSKNPKYARRLDPNCSVFVVQGEKDQVLTPKSARKVFARIPTSNKEMLVVKNCGHILIGTNHVKHIVSQSITAWLEHNSASSQLATTPAREDATGAQLAVTPEAESAATSATSPIIARTPAREDAAASEVAEAPAGMMQ